LSTGRPLYGGWPAQGTRFPTQAATNTASGSARCRSLGSTSGYVESATRMPVINAVAVMSAAH
jgi:hypothetical protein